MVGSDAWYPPRDQRHGDPSFLTYMATYDVASTIHQSRSSVMWQPMTRQTLSISQSRNEGSNCVL